LECEGDEAYGNHPHLEVQVETEERGYDQHLGNAVGVSLVLDEETGEGFNESPCRLVENVFFIYNL
jgi:hypothetical protein